MARYNHLTVSDHKRIGRQLSRGVPFDRALRNVQNKSPRQSRPQKNHPLGAIRARSSRGLQDNFGLSGILVLLTLISGTFTLVSVLSIYSKFGFGTVGTLAVSGYLVLWEIVGATFSTAERKVPTPLRIMIKILEKAVEIIAPSP